MLDDTNLILTEVHSAEEVRNYTGSFCGFVLLSHEQYTLNNIYKNLKEQWGIVPLEQGFCMNAPMDLMFDVPGAMVTISLLAEPIPEQEAEMAAAHAVWSGAKDAALSHKAHLMVAVMPQHLTAVESAVLYCKVLSACMATDDMTKADSSHTLAVYTSGTILSPEYVAKAVDEIRTGNVPFEMLIHIGTYTGSTGTGGYTVGMDAFGKDELEVLDCAESEAVIHDVLYSCAKRILEQDLQTGWYVRLECDGVIWEGRRKDGVMVEGHSVQLTNIN